MRAVRVGILALHAYFPNCYVDQSKLEEFDQVSRGKYTIGFGQSKMAVCEINEDTVSLALNAMIGLLYNNNIDMTTIGRLEVGSESIVDKSKSIKSYLMQFFTKNKIFDLEGVDNINACFGGTAALFNTINWIYSPYWNGKCGLVVMSDIACYDSSAKAVGGAGAAALLIGPNAPLIFDEGLRYHHMEHCYDFYKPIMSSEYPTVDGRLSLSQFIRSSLECLKGYRSKVIERNKDFQLNDGYFIFHTPYSRLVQKTYSYLRDFEQNNYTDEAIHHYFEEIWSSGTQKVRDFESRIISNYQSDFDKFVAPSLEISKIVGNCYCASLYCCLISLINCHSEEELSKKRVLFYSYGSGSTSAMFSATFCNNINEISKLKKCTNRVVDELKEKRTEMSPEQLENLRQERTRVYNDLGELSILLKSRSHNSINDQDQLNKNIFYLSSIDDNFRRYYSILDA